MYSSTHSTEGELVTAHASGSGNKEHWRTMSLLENLAVDLEAQFRRLLFFLEPMDLVHLSLTCRLCHRTLERDDAIWAEVIQRNPALQSTFLWPSCFSNRQKVIHALKTLRELQKEARLMRADLEKEKGAPSLEATWSSLRKFITQTEEPLLNSSRANTLFAKPKRKITLGGKGNSNKEEDAINAAIEKQLAKDKQHESSNNNVSVFLIGLDPALTFQFWLQAAHQMVKGDSTTCAREEIWALILRESQALVRGSIRMLGGPKLAAAERILAAPLTAEGFLSVTSDIPAAWTEHATKFLSILSRDLQRQHGRILGVLAAQHLVTSSRWKDVQNTSYQPTPMDGAVAGGSMYGARTFQITNRNMRIRLIDPTANFLLCKRSRVLRAITDEKGALNLDMVVCTLDVVTQAPTQVIKNPAWGLFEQMKLLELLLNSGYFRGITITILANTDGVEAFQLQNSQQDLLFVRERLRVITRTPATLLLSNITLTTPNDPKLCDQLLTSLNDLFLTRNIQRGF